MSGPRRSAVRPLPLVGGLAVLAAAWLGPLPGLAREAFSAHMTMHVSVVALAAPLLALGLAGRGYDPARVAPGLFAPIPVSALELVVVWGWHAPALHHAARHSAGAMALEQGSFLLSGLLVWLSAFGGDPADRGRRAVGIVGMLLTSMHMTLLGALLGLAPRPLYPHTQDPWLGLTALQVQHVGGALMLLGGGVSYLVGGIALAVSLLRSSGAFAGSEGGSGGGSGGADAGARRGGAA